MTLRSQFRIAALALSFLSAPPARAGAKIPEGVPFQTDYRAARREALRTGRPMFLYFTKTY